MFSNIGGKIGNYELVLPLTAALVAEIETICANFANIYNFVETSDATSQSLTAWRDLAFKGTQPSGPPLIGEPLPAAPVFNNIGAIVGKTGMIPRFKEIHRLIVASPGYTQVIGEDL